MDGATHHRRLARRALTLALLLLTPACGGYEPLDPDDLAALYGDTPSLQLALTVDNPSQRPLGRDLSIEAAPCPSRCVAVDRAHLALPTTCLTDPNARIRLHDAPTGCASPVADCHVERVPGAARPLLRCEVRPGSISFHVTLR